TATGASRLRSPRPWSVERRGRLRWLTCSSGAAAAREAARRCRSTYRAGRTWPISSSSLTREKCMTNFHAAAQTIPKNDLAAQLCQIGLLDLAECLEDFLARATKARLSHRQLLEELVRLEQTERAKRSLERRLLRSRLGRFKPITDFDWGWPKNIERDVIERALTLDFIQDNRNLILMGTNGLGKTMLAKNLGHKAAVAGYSVLFLTAAELIDDLR